MPPIRIPSLRRDQRVSAKMKKARDAVLDLARLMPNHAGPNAEFTRFMVNLQAELRRGGYLLMGDGKGGFLPTAADFAARGPQIYREVCPVCKTGWVENGIGRCECYPN